MWRASVVFSLIALAFAVIVLRLFYWQVLASESLRQEASDQYYMSLELPANRGEIRADDGAPLAMNVPSYLVYAEPKHIQDKYIFASKIAPALSLDPNKLLGEISEKDRVWSPIAKRVDNDVVTAVKQLNLTGVGFEQTAKRYYPEASMAAQLLGFVGSDEFGNDKGYFGLEGFYDRELKGKDGYLQIEKDVRGAPIPVGEVKRIEPHNGRDLTLWLDRTIQHIAEVHLNEGIEKYGAKQGSVVIMDPKTGGILAMASFPSYDPLTYGAYDKSLYRNPVVADSYEPGSTFKTLVMVSALNEHLVTPQTTMDENGPVPIGPYWIRTWNNQYHGIQTMTQIIQNSSNVGMVFVGNKLGIGKMVKYIRSFGFGLSTGIDLQDDTTPDIRDANDWKEIDLATSSFGQGIAVTPMQMVRAVGAIANDGWLMEPHMVKSITDDNGKIVEMSPKRLGQIVSKEAANEMTEIMINAVDNGEAKWAKPKGYRIAGKTGTAQIPVSGHYDNTKTIASFVGFAPADNPAFVMLVTIREPSSSQWGSETAAPLFFSIAQDIFMYKGITPQS